MTTDLPSWDGPRGGSGCTNEDCDVADTYVRVLSREEIERIYPRPDRLPQWPLPEQFTHMCTHCGQAYAGYPYSRGFEEPDHDGPVVDLDQWEWDQEAAYDDTVRGSIHAMIDGAPDETGTEVLIEAVDRYVPGAGRDLARDVLAERGDAAADPAADFL